MRIITASPIKPRMNKRRPRPSRARPRRAAVEVIGGAAFAYFGIVSLDALALEEPGAMAKAEVFELGGAG